MLKWAGFNNRYNTWEPEEELSCDELLEEFEKSSFRSIIGNFLFALIISYKMCNHSFALFGTCLGVRKANHSVSYFVKFLGQNKGEQKTTEEMRSKWPMQTIKYLQEQIEWVTSINASNSNQHVDFARVPIGEPVCISCKF